MKLFIIATAFVFFHFSLSAQLPEDALRLSWNAPSGTARQQAIGGAMGSLGGEISAAFVNPAGWGLYRANDFVLSPGITFLKNNINFRGTHTDGKTATSFTTGATGAVFSSIDENGASSTFGIAVSQTANFKNNLLYNGQNNYSSYSEQYAEEFASSGLSINDGINSPSLSYGTRMALYSYLIDTATVNGNTQVIGLPTKTGLLNQQNNMASRGATTEVAFAYAAELANNKKWCLGLTLGIPVVYYNRVQTFTETDATGNTNNDFASSVYTENYTTKGAGFNLKAGAIYKPSAGMRFGFAVHSPTLYFLTDNISATMVTNTENYAHEVSITSGQLDAGSGYTANSIKYDYISPWKFIASGSYLFGGEAQNIKQQKGFITADIEYTTNSTMKFKPYANSDNGSTSVPGNYFDGVNSAIKNSYKGIFDFRIGGELKFNTIAARAGFAYYTNPYKDGALKANRMYISGGLGYRNKGMFIDLTYVQGFTKDVNFPYRLADKANTFSTINQTSATVIVTVGFKFL